MLADHIHGVQNILIYVRCALLYMVMLPIVVDRIPPVKLPSSMSNVLYCTGLCQHRWLSTYVYMDYMLSLQFYSDLRGMGPRIPNPKHHPAELLDAAIIIPINRWCDKFHMPT